MRQLGQSLQGVLLTSMLLLLFVACAFIVAAAADAKPYVLDPQVPNAPKAKLYGTYETALFPGSATYSYALEVPPGTNKLQPSFMLSYDSQLVTQLPSIVGAGWKVSQWHIARDTNGSIANESRHQFVLAFDNQVQQLYFNPVDGRFHTEIESFDYIQNVTGAPNRNGQYWILTNKEGVAYRFGYHNDSERESQRFNFTQRWYLDQVTDSFGNTIRYNYTEDPFSQDNGTTYLQSISYNNDGTRALRFVYEPTSRPDLRLVYDHGDFVRYTRRLAAVEVMHTGTLVRRYNLSYARINNESTITPLSNITYVGNDNTTVLHTVRFAYEQFQPGYRDVNQWIVPQYFSYSTQPDHGVRHIDINRDGYIDIIYAEESGGGHNQTWINNKTGGWQNETYAVGLNAPEFFVNISDHDAGLRLVDVDNDGLPDLVRSSDVIGGVHINRTYLNTGTTWVSTTNWSVPLPFVSGQELHGNNDPDQSIQFADFNGDSLTDMLRSIDNRTSMFINNGTTWVNDSVGWNDTISFIDISGFTGSTIADVNGDGLPDIICYSNRAYCQRRAIINTGSGWADMSSVWGPPIQFTNATRPDLGVRMFDINADGLVDLVRGYKQGTATYFETWLNNGSGWSNASQWTINEVFSVDGFEAGRRIGDVNGDGLADLLVSYYNGSAGEKRTLLKNGSQPYLLRAITTEYGGVISMDYAPSTIGNHTNYTNSSTLGFNIWTVANVTKNNSISGSLASFGITVYNYSGGVFDYREGQFRGFGTVNERRPDNTTIIHQFHQDRGRRGREHTTTTQNASGVLLKREQKEYATTADQNGYYITLLASETNSVYDGASQPLATRIQYDYDTKGNVLAKTLLGDVNEQEDDKFERYEYASNTTKGMAKLSRKMLYDFVNHTKVQESRYYYDERALGATPGAGALTRTEQWLPNGENPATTYEYDSFGNVVRKIDPNGQATEYVYGIRDTTRTFVDRTINELGHNTDTSTDSGTGQVLWEEKQGRITTFTYDSFGRPLTQTKPYDTPTQPTTRTNYSFDGSAPEFITTTARTTSNNSVSTTYAYDGLGNLIQINSQATDGYVTKDIYYDAQGRISAESNPYFSNGQGLVTNASINRTVYGYDGLSRVVRVINPDGSSRNVTFNRTLITLANEKANPTDYVIDGHGRIRRIIEHNTNPNTEAHDEYTTNYQYDTLDNLARITDDQGNQFFFEYDALGRKTGMIDPDLGNWTYAYDANGNLVLQVDNRGMITTFSYDGINRIVRKNSSNTTTPVLTYAYDQQWQGTLSNVSAGNVSYSFLYDERLRVTEERRYAGQRAATFRSFYDSSDRVVQKTLPTGAELEYVHVPQGLVSTIKGFVNSTTYNAFGNPASVLYANNITTTYAYDSTRGRLRRIEAPNVQNMSYGYDSVGNVLSINDSTINSTSSMTYDAIDRLLNVSLNATQYTYAYDSIGNMKRITRGANNRTLLEYGVTPTHAPFRIIDDQAGMGVETTEVLHINTTTRVLEATIVNDRQSGISDANWTLDFGDGNQVTSNPFNVSAGKDVLIFAQNTYADGGTYNMNLSAGGAGARDTEGKMDTSGMRLMELSTHENLPSMSVASLVLGPDNNVSSNNATWGCLGIISAQFSIPIASNETVLVVQEFNGTSTGSLWQNCSVTGSGNESDNTEQELEGLEITNLSAAYVDADTRRVTFDIINRLPYLTINYTLTTEGQDVTGVNTNATTGAVWSVTHLANYSTPGAKTIQVSAATTSIRITRTTAIDIPALRIEQYQSSAGLNLTRNVAFNITNHWLDNRTVTWSVNNPSISGGPVTIPVNTSYRVSITLNHTSAGRKDIMINATDGAYTDQVNETYDARAIEIESLAVLSGGATSVTEAVVRNLANASNVTWRYESGEQNITPSAVSLGSNASLFAFIQTTYSNTGVSVPACFANTTSDTHNLTTVVLV